MGRRRKSGRRLHGILLLDKPAGGSSNKVLQRVRRFYNANKAGHTGSLDPLATGMLPICFGEATRLGSFLIDADKGYETTLRLGVITDSADADGEVIETRPVAADIDQARVAAVVAGFAGPQMQIPPMVSAIKVDGKRLYKIAREGGTVERKARPVNISDIRLLCFDGETARLSVRCSKGTYIRALVTDIGEQLGCGAHVTQLRRTFVAPFEGLRMWTEQQLEALPDPDSALLPPDAGLQHMPKALLEDVAATLAFRQGQVVDALVVPGTATAALQQVADNTPAPGREGWCRVYSTEQQLVGLGELDATGRIAPRRVLQWD